MRLINLFFYNLNSFIFYHFCESLTTSLFFSMSTTSSDSDETPTRILIPREHSENAFTSDDTDSSVEIPSTTDEDDTLSDEEQPPPCPYTRYSYHDLPPGVHLPSIPFKSFTDEHLNLLKKYIEEGTLSKIHFKKCYHIKHSTFLKIYKEHDIEPPTTPRGRPKQKVPREVTQMVLDLHQKMPVGVTKTYEKFLHDMFLIQGGARASQSVCEMTSYIPESIRTQPPPSYHMFQKIFKEEGLYQYRPRGHTDIGKSRYVACTTNLIWHVDIHFIKVPGRVKLMPFYAILDDKSRYLLNYSKLRRKTAENCLCVLKDTIQMWGKPYCIWSDNGGENAGVFKEYLEEHNIKHVHTLPHSPQQNGKMEVWWKTLDRYTAADTSDERITHCINMFNDTPQKGLPRIYIQINGKNKHVHQTPVDIYFEKEGWKEGDATKWKVTKEGAPEIELEFLPDAQENEEFEEENNEAIEYDWD